MIATYISHGRGRSVNAELAENAGKIPLSRAIPALAKRLGITRKQARVLLECFGTCEWHHTGSLANMTDYYDVEAVAADIPNDEYGTLESLACCGFLYVGHGSTMHPVGALQAALTAARGGQS